MNSLDASARAAVPSARSAGTWLPRWEPEDGEFWSQGGASHAWRTLVVTTFCLTLSFATWFVVSALVVRLPAIGFKYDTMQLFWLAAMPGLAGGTLRIVHSFLIPIYGTRGVLTVSNWIKLVPCVGLGMAVSNPETPYWVFLTLAFLAGLGGGDFSSFMPSTSLFFPKRLQGTALGIQAGIGNFGVSLAQFVTPWIIGFAIAGALGGPQVFSKGGVTKDVWLQNATFWYVPLLAIGGILSWSMLRSVPVRASFREQLDIFKDRHTWFCTVTYVMTFGSFSGFSAAFPLMIMSVYGKFPDAPDPLAFAFLGPLIGSAARVLFGFVADRTGGGILTQLSGAGLIACCALLVFGGYLTPTSLEPFSGFVGIMLLIFLFAGIGNASTFRQFPIVFKHSPRQGAQVLGWTAAVAAYGPFLFSSAIGASIAATGSSVPFFWVAAGFYVVASAINWWFYVRNGCERPS
ncbi:MAG: NarK/NasA family nitrate transporter [Candidatus Sericytochromatia bacterium]|nr:NarK/NasA family nitrate transporter [Candidatus Tanganyikabacteria bacterium]